VSKVPTPEEQRRLLNARDDLPPSVGAELAALTAMQTYLLELGETRAAAKIGRQWARRFAEPAIRPPAPALPPDVEAAPNVLPAGTLTRRLVEAKGLICGARGGQIEEVIVSTPDNHAIAPGIRAFLRAYYLSHAID